MMTYNWDNMVEITVPKGTNGWVYSGEVTINGVNVKFPVGTPTTVPEPAAALLNKMIELEREDDLSGAKPNNHYVGNVTVPDGKTLTLQKGAKVVDEAGVLGGSSASSPVVILPETTLTVIEDGLFMSDKPPTAYPEVGKNYAVTINGTEYVLPAIEDEGAIVLGNNDFAVLIASPEMAAEYGAYIMVEYNVDSVTLSIVDASSGGNAGGGGSGVLMVHATLDMGNADMSDPSAYTIPCTMDKTYAEITEAISGGSFAVCEADFSGAKYYLPIMTNRGDSINFGIQFGSTVFVVDYNADNDAMFVGQNMSAE